ncbi:nucleoside phosphorylase domain-containing protein [Penicillium canescens]|uniref:Nucleoside phosphorylase domain-containing protein n=1 Tax=Penicillium canescens TaxID=5083 RepID=A0AAD6IEH8_PENCN|nr:nucleoside phosphorylase domain-containing protein [Penicillium canescens]KAJ6044435.1 nucleoside phosphorylase domain-containing protein [Penicillium canescens]KAJ6055905.1 nucleoside phosphorylase domain-containing protein [Penicillium canescens]KAJ6074853.1 nucleoside phosphorylase domain-containing protein [Penicillium canescens]KAJ6082062.1 nucleoside phosphorylase domain-containing protein [Penicillium canescens]KAJ6176141.1 nucleoside phosphorylase domain-containing protein [Penicill
MKRNRPQPDDFHIGWITALPIEFTAARMMLDEEYESEDETSNDYTIGRIGHHNIVLTCLPAGQIGTTAAATAAAQISSNFPLKFGLLVGIGGGVPTEETDIRLGDVVISQPNGEYGGVVQHDLGKATAGGKWKRTGYLNAPPEALLKAVSKMRSDKMMGKALIHQYLPSPSHFPMFDRAKAGRDVLFLPNYDHVNGPTCNECRQDMIIDRSLRGTDEGIEAHYGTIASGNQVIKDAHTRDKLSAELGGVLCFEMEAAGLMNSLPSLVIRGICDYADSHKNKTWQPFAAVTAAACAKQILSILPRSSVLKSPLAQGQLAEQISFRDLVVLNDALGNKHVFSLRFVPSTEVEISWWPLLILAC